MGIRSNKVGGDIKGKREREKMRISREMFNFKKLDKEEKKKKMSKGSEPWETQLNTLIHFFQNQQLGFVSSNPTCSLTI